MGKGLSPEQIVRRVREAAEPVVASFGLMLWGILTLVKRHMRKHPKKPKAEPKKED